MTAFPEPGEYPFGPDEYTEHVYRAKQAVAIPVIGSLNGRTPEAWLKFAREIEHAGADALELNMYEVPADLAVPGTAVESQLVGVVRELKRLIKIPIAVKLSPFFAALGNVAQQLDAAGADALVLFNRFYQPDIDIRTMSVVPQAELSTSAELLMRLRWIAILHGRIRPSLAASGGVVTPHDGIKADPRRCGRRSNGFRAVATRSCIRFDDASGARTVARLAQDGLGGRGPRQGQPEGDGRCGIVRARALHPNLAQLDTRAQPDVRIYVPKSVQPAFRG